MPTSVISEPELRALGSWPDDVAHSDLVACLCLGLEDIRWLRSHRNPVTRLAQGLRLTGLPYPGFVPHPVEAPHTVPGPHKPRPIRPHQPLQHLQPQRRSRTPTNPTPTPQTCPNPLAEVQPADLAQMISHPPLTRRMIRCQPTPWMAGHRPTLTSPSHPGPGDERTGG